MNRSRLLGFIGSFTLLAGCAYPTTQDFGRMILLSAPFWFLMGWVALAWLWWLWRRAVTTLAEPSQAAWLPSLLAAGVLLIGALMGGLTMTADGWAWFFGPRGNYWLFSVMVGLGYVTVSLTVWRIWFRGRNPNSFSWALLPVLALYWLPAVPLVLGPATSSGESDLAGLYALAVFPGLFGVPTAFVLLLLTYEAVRARRMLATRDPAPTSD